MSRDVDAIDAEITGARNRQRAKAAARDRRERDMLSALRDVENYEAQIAYDDAHIDKLLGERAAVAQGATA